MLSQAAFDRARHFIETQARPLEQARFQYHFANAGTVVVEAALAALQNPDGGFGHGIEPDLRTPDSSALGTSIALQVLREIGGGPSVIATSAIAYLIATYLPALHTWRIIPPSAAASPHAPWWQREEDAPVTFGLNPTAELLGYLLDYRKQVSVDWLAELTQTVLTAITAAESLEMHDFLCCQRLAASPGLAPSDRSHLIKTLQAHLPAAVAMNADEWDSYCLRPLEVANHPDSPFYPDLQTAIAANLDYEVANQQANGAWLPTWDWGGDYPDAWAIAKQEWSGVLTVNKLLTLKRYSYIQFV